MKFKHLVLAGTFDHFHLGHRKFIQTSLNNAYSASCGLTTNWINKNKVFPLTIQPFEKRLRSLKKFIQNNRLSQKTKIFSLNDSFGPAVSDSSFDAISATKESLKGAELVNEKRKMKGLNPLPILLIDLIKANDQQRISSHRIRLGTINRQGLVYKHSLAKNNTLYLPKNQRHYFKKPIGKLLTGPGSNLSWASLKAFRKIKKDRPPFIITVGDITTQTFLLNQLPINLAIIDYRCQRRSINFNLHSQLRKKASFQYLVKNNPGTLSSETTFLLRNILPQILIANKSAIIQIRGEEDLLVLPAILLSPLKTLIFYGQPNKGLVQIEVEEKIKKKALNLLQKFKPYYC